MSRSLLALTAVLALTVPLSLQAYDKKAEAPQSATAVSTEYDTKVGKVIEIDHAKNTLVLEGEGGSRLELVVDPNKVKNFKNIKKGDLVKVQQEKSWALTLSKKEKGEKPSAAVVTEKETAPTGGKPGMEAVKTAEISAEIVKVDPAKSLVELKGPAGNVLALTAKDPKKLEGLKKGDMVTATYTVAVAVSVEAAK